MAEPFTDKQLEALEEAPMWVETNQRFLATITAREKRIEELEKERDGWRNDANRFFKTIADQTAEIERLKNLLKALSAFLGGIKVWDGATALLKKDNEFWIEKIRQALEGEK